MGNLDAREGRYLRWDAAAPTETQPAIYNGTNWARHVQGDHNPVHLLTMKGNATADLDNIAFDLFFTGWAQIQSLFDCPLALSLQLMIDDQEVVYQPYQGSDGFNYTRVDDTTVKTRFVLTNLWQATKDLGLSYGPDVQHEIYLNVQNFYACMEVTWQYDSVSRPSGLIVNHPNPGSAYFKFNVLDPPPPRPA